MKLAAQSEKGVFHLSINDLPVPTLMVDFRAVAGFAAWRHGPKLVANTADLPRLLSQCMIVEANQNALEFFGSPDAHSLNDNGCFRAEFYEASGAYLAAFWTGEQTDWHETMVYTLDGASRAVMIRARPFSHAGDGFDHLMWSFSDVSSLKSAQADAELARIAAEEANESKSTFLAVMSHEIRTPLNGVLGMAQLLLQKPLPAQDREMVSVIAQSGEALLAILNDMLDLAKIEAGRMELEVVEFDLAELVNGAHNAFTGIAHKKGLSFNVVIAPDARGAYAGDPTRLRQILYNLISNALKFTETGEVRVEVRRRDGEIVISVADTGIGIAQDKLAKLFDSFTQADSSTSRKYGGTGLGLSICRQLAELMGGHIAVDSRLGAGSTFALSVALEQVDAATAPPVSRGPGVACAAGVAPAGLDRVVKILAAEDNAVNQLVLKTMLLAVGVDLTVVANGRLAVDAWAAERFDLVLMDVQMPEMDGISAVREIRRREGERGLVRTPVIALTANAMVHQVEQYRDAGMDGHVEKPIRIDRLLAAIQAAVAAPENDEAALPSEISGAAG